MGDDGGMLANLILLVHAAFVLGVVAGLPAIWIGASLRHRWPFNRWLRGLHLAAIGFVVAESVLGYTCPLTLWEDSLRGSGGDGGFIQRWVGAALYWRAPAWVFTACYVAFGLLVVWTWIRLPPVAFRPPPPRPGCH